MRKRVLMVQQDPATAGIQQLIEERLDVEVRCAPAVGALPALLKVHLPAAVVVYADSARGEVYRLIDRLKGKGKTVPVPILVIADAVDVGYELRCQGAAAYIVRPFGPGAFVELLGQLAQADEKAA